MYDIKYLGIAGHHAMANKARFQLHSHINDKFCISTVGRIVVNDTSSGLKNEELLIMGYVLREEELIPTYYEIQVRKLDPNPHKDNDGNKICYCPHGSGQVIEGNMFCFETTAQIAHWEIVKTFSEV